MAEDDRRIHVALGGPPTDERVELGDRRDHAGELLPFGEQTIDERIHRGIGRGLREHEVQRRRAERHCGHVVPVGDDPQVEHLVQIRFLHQRRRDAEHQVVACFVAHQVGRGHVPERVGIVETADQHRENVAQRDRRAAHE